jgi:hypothetical protein
MLKHKFNIGDRIRIKAYDEMPVDIRTRASGRLCGKVGTVTDKLYSNSTGDFLYLVKLDDFDEESKKMWDAGCLELYRETIADYAFKFSAEGGAFIRDHIQGRQGDRKCLEWHLPRGRVRHSTSGGLRYGRDIKQNERGAGG